MHVDDLIAWIAITTISFAIAAAMFGSLGQHRMREMEKQAISCGYAEYVVEDRTVKFQWVEKQEMEVE